MRHGKWFAAAVVLALILPAAAQDDKPLYPLKVGTKWSYKVKDQEEKFVVTAAKEEMVGDQNCVKLEARLKDQVVASEHVAVLKDGIYRFKFDDKTIEPPVCFCKLPATKGQKWEVKFKVAGKEGVGKFESGEEEISVPAGKFQAVVVKGEVVEDSVPIKMTLWFAPGSGIVRQLIDGGGQQPIVLELESIERPAEKKDQK
jgi:hypothetical protein